MLLENALIQTVAKGKKLSKAVCILCSIFDLDNAQIFGSLMPLTSPLV